MINSDARVSALRKSLAAITAFTLMFTMVASSFPALAIAQDVPSDAPVVETPAAPVETPTETKTLEVVPPAGDAGTQSSTQSTPTDDQTPPAGAEPISPEDLAVLESQEATTQTFGGLDLTITKVLIKDNVGNTDTYDDFSVSVKEYKPFLIWWVPNGTSSGTFDAVTGEIEQNAKFLHRYVIEENAAPGYTTTYSGGGTSCDFVYIPFISTNCTITNDDIPPAGPVIPTCDLGDSTTFDPFALGTVNGQGGWGVTGPYDQEVVDNTYGFTTFGCKSLRVSNAVTSGSFGDHTFSYSIPNEAGETAAQNGGMSGGTRQNHIEIEFDLATTKPTEQSGLALSVSPDRGDGARMSYLRFEDKNDGVHVYFSEATPTGGFTETELPTLNRATPHTIKFAMTFIDGKNNDIVKIYIDGVLVKTGTSWENYFTETEGNPTRTVDSLLIRTGGVAVSGNDEEGFLFDNFSIVSSTVTPPVCKMVSDDVNTFIGKVPASAVVPHPNWSSQLLPDGAKWIWDAPSSTDDEVVFTRTFNASDAGTATLDIAADNGYSVTVNGNPLSCDGTGGSNFAATESCTFPVVAGENEVEFTVRNDGGAANPANGNPAGLYYKISITGSTCTEVPPVQYSTVTMCKMDDKGNNLPDWTLMLKGNGVQNGLNIPVNTSAGVSSNSLTAGVSYIVTAMGTWNNQGGANVVDAEYSTTNGWTTHMDGYDGYSTDILELQINSAFDPNSNWGPYSDTHTYARAFVPSVSGAANFRIFDGTGTTQNEGWFGDNSGSLTVSIGEGFTGVTGANGCVTFANVPYGVYNADEIQKTGWVDVSGRGTVTVDSPTETFTIVNSNPNAKECVLVSDKTTLEGGMPSDLVAGPFHPSWTAVVDALAAWIWGDTSVTDPTAEETQTFTKTFWLDAAPAASSTLKIAADNQYIVEVNGSWTHTDANEDNYTAAGEDTIEVPVSAFNAGANTIVFTVKNMAMGGGTQATNPAGLRYKLTIDGTNCVQTAPDQDQVQVHILKYIESNDSFGPATAGAPSFPMTSTWDATNMTGSGSYALDSGNGYKASTSLMDDGADYATAETTGGIVLAKGDQCVAGKYRLVGYKTGDTLIEAENDATSIAAPSFTDLEADKYVIVVNEDCNDPIDGNQPQQRFVHIYKYLADGNTTTQVADGAAGVPTFPMASTWTASNLNGGVETSGTYTLGTNYGGAYLNFAASTSPMTAPYSYTTSEVTDVNSNVLPAGEQCVAGKYRLVGYKSGATLAAAEAAAVSQTAPAFVNASTDNHVIVVNEDCDDVINNQPGTQTITITGNTSAAENVLGWMFGRDTNTETPFSFVSGNQSIGTGSLFVPAITNTVDGNSDKFIGELFMQTPVSQLNSISFDFKIGGPADTVEEQFYMNVYMTASTSVATKYYDCRYDVVASTGSTAGYTTVTFDLSQAIVAPSSVKTHASSPHQPCPATPADMGADAKVRAIAITLGDSTASDTGVSGYFDKVVVNTDSMVTTYDFEPAAPAPTNNGGGGGGGGSSTNSNDDDEDGQVLGASTDAACSMLLKTFMGMGRDNDPGEVGLLQDFLNTEMGSALPLSGVFGPQTNAAVHAFQQKYWQDVLEPWFTVADSGIADQDDSTGYVYKTTQWKINMINCPGLNLPLPQLP